MALGSVTFGGLATGLPSDMVDQLMQAEQGRLINYQQQKSSYKTRESALSTLESKLSTLESKAVALQDSDSFKPHTASSSDESKMTVTADSSALAAIHSVEITQLATFDTWILDDGDGAGGGTGLSSETDVTLNAGSTFQFDYLGNTYDQDDFGITAGDSLEQIAERINSYDWPTGEDGVSAGVMYDGSNYRLTLTSNASGTADALSNLGGTLNFDDGASIDVGTEFYNSIAAQDADMTVDGLTGITSTSNTVSDVIPGVTLELLEANPGTTIYATISNDTSALQETAEEFVSAFNSVIDYINAEKNKGLSSDSVVRSVIYQLRREVNTETNVTGDYSSLAAIGITTDEYTGKLSLDSSDFSAAVSDDFDAVAEIFTNTGSTGETDDDDAGLSYRIESYIEELTAFNTGSITVRQSGVSDRISRLDDRILSEQERLERVREQLTLKYSRLEQLVNSLNSQGGAMTAALSKL
jgi:flagellar hook-associated protein 2